MYTEEADLDLAGKSVLMEGNDAGMCSVIKEHANKIYFVAYSVCLTLEFLVCHD